MADHSYPVRGDIDLSRSTELQDELLELVATNDDDLTLDCDTLEFIDSSGIAVFVHLQKLLETQGRQFRVVNLSARARRPFEMLGLTEVLGIAGADSLANGRTATRQ